MYLFCLMFFIFLSICLVFLILLSPSKGLNNRSTFHTVNNTKLFSHFGKQNCITNVITGFSFLFLIVSIILCNINSRKIDADFFLKDNIKYLKKDQSFPEKKPLNSDIPN